MSHRTVGEISHPFTPFFTAVALLDHGPFASLELVLLGRLACASVPNTPRLHVRGVETLAGGACPACVPECVSEDLAAPATAPLVKSVAASANSIAAVLLQKSTMAAASRAMLEVGCTASAVAAHSQAPD